jgi:diguanylate cyclase (GGDEF)-like protein/PAS domain S-box-containing protein
LVLIADDDPAIRLLVQGSLSAHGYEIHEAADGRVALEAIERLSPDIVLCDVMMPHKDGYAVCDAVRKQRDGQYIPIVMLTGLHDTESIERAYAAGATDFILKPINWSILPRRIQYILRASSALRDLHESEERYALAAQGANDGLWDWDISADVVYYSPRWKTMLGYKEEQIDYRLEEWHERIHPEDRPRVQKEIGSHLQGYTNHFECEYRIHNNAGNYLWMMARGVAVRDSEGRPYRMAGSQTDITERKSAESQLLFDALHDKLTKLPNRTLFLDRLSHALKLHQRCTNIHFAVLFIDLDRFKVINDSLGHLRGDQLLIEVSKRMLQVLRPGDTLARLGGDEFTVLFEDVGEIRTVTGIADRIQEAVSAPIDLDGQRLVVSGSMGIAVSTTGYDRPEDVLRDADAAMYRAKSGGRGRYELFDPEMHEQVCNALRLETELRDALAREEFRVVYQPIVDLKTSRISGFEALVRWNHPVRGILLPEAFLEVAEASRIIVQLGRWVLFKACAQMREWLDQFPTQSRYVSVNLSSAELAQPDLVSAIDDILEKTRLPGRSLRLEITETALIDNTNCALEVMAQLRKREIHLSIDDFGTGYSSFSYLHLFPFNTLKIDRSFVKNLEHDSNCVEIVKTIVTLAHNLGLDVVAEGGETSAIIEHLKEIPCDFHQGFSFSDPSDPKTMSDMIRAEDEHANHE